MRILIAVLCLMLSPAAAIACGPDSDCPVGDRHYRIAMPTGADTGSIAVPVIVFAHGFRGSAAGVMRNGALRGLATELGAALIAVKSDGPGWDLPNGPRTLDSTGAAEFAYFEAVLADAAERFDIDRARMMATGFSAGGMMVWNLACARPEMFAGFAPVAGTFWRAPPARCADPVTSIIHVHGDADRTVPLTGREIGPTRQGDVSEALAMYADFGGFGSPTQTFPSGLACRERQNAGGALLHFCLFEGGHSFRIEHVRHAWKQLQQAGKL